MNKVKDAREYVRSLVNIAYIGLGIPLLIFIWVYLESSSEKLVPVFTGDVSMVILMICGVMSIALFWWGRIKFSVFRNKARALQPLTEQLSLYKKAILYRFISYALMATLVTVGYFLTDFAPFEALFGGMIVLFSIHNPTARSVVSDLKLQGEDKTIVLKGQNFVN